MWKKILFTLFCIVYGAALTGVLLVLRFPEERLLSHASRALERRLPGFSVSIGDLGYRFPLELRFIQVRLRNPAEIIDVNLGEVLVTLERSNPASRAHIIFDVFGGRVESDINLDRTSGRIDVAGLSAAGIRLAEIDPLQQRLARPVEGVLTLSGRYEAETTDLFGGTFSGNLRIADLLIRLRRPILQDDELFFDELSARTTLADALIEISEGVADGPHYTGRFTGTIRVAPQWQESRLAVNGQLLPQEDYVSRNQQVARAVALLNKKYGTEEIPCRIEGSLRDPQFQFGTDSQRVL
jgi:type II secretion system protein N